MYMNKIKAKIVIFQESMEIFCYSWWKVESQQGLKPRASGIPCQRSNHWATETQFIDWQSPPWHITRLMLNKIRITLKTKLFKFFIHSQVWNILYLIHCKTGYRLKYFIFRPWLQLYWDRYSLHLELFCKTGTRLWGHKTYMIYPLNLNLTFTKVTCSGKVSLRLIVNIMSKF